MFCLNWGSQAKCSAVADCRVNAVHHGWVGEGYQAKGSDIAGWVGVPRDRTVPQLGGGGALQ